MQGCQVQSTTGSEDIISIQYYTPAMFVTHKYPLRLIHSSCIVRVDLWHIKFQLLECGM